MKKALTIIFSIASLFLIGQDYSLQKLKSHSKFSLNVSYFSRSTESSHKGQKAYIDLDNDQYLDMVSYSEKQDSIVYFINDKSFGFENEVLVTDDFTKTGDNLKNHFADFNNDDYKDFVFIQSNKLMLSLNNNGVFSTPTVISNTDSLISIYITDYDNDDELDILCIQNNVIGVNSIPNRRKQDLISLLFFKGSGGGNFDQPENLGTYEADRFSNYYYNTPGYSILSCDKLSSNGNKFVFIQNTFGNLGASYYSLEIKPGSTNIFTTIFDISHENTWELWHFSHNTNFQLIDFNHDGFLDYSLSESVYLNDGSDNFNIASQYNIPHDNPNCDKCDYDQSAMWIEGKNNSIYAFSKNQLLIFNENSNQMEASSELEHTSDQEDCLDFENDSILDYDFVDLNNDGQKEIVFTTFRCKSTYMYNLPLLTSTKDFQKAQFEVFPNPTNNVVNIKTDSKELLSYKVFNQIGILVQSGQFIQQTQLDLSNLASSIYSVQISGDKTAISTKRIIKK